LALWKRVVADHAAREPLSKRAAGKERPDVVVHPLGAEMDEHWPAELAEVVGPDHDAEKAQRIFVRDLDHVRHFGQKYFADRRVLDHVLPRHHDPVTLVEDRRILGGDVVDLGEIVDGFFGFGLARNDETHLAAVAGGGVEEVVEARADPARVLVVVVGDVD
jgi:hypothetical protein